MLARVEPGDSIVVDGDNAQVLVRPAEDILQTIHAAIEARDERRRKYMALRDLPSATRDQARISLHMNAGFIDRHAASRRDRRRWCRPVPD